ncbi:MAG: methyltransferase domain-containing protein [Deltaproteobacteria bacterium]|jgi:ubiquinone/menaquinone biosynthesis C-methylase UbiE|nr:methyltransferase domain-containing protein [Deltaproteobacteria bacterium]MBW2530905.1 methyltransferase domain-containing protein [Deltaproteobacteria bacterium]
MSFAVPLTAAEAAIYESLVIPRYMQTFGEMAVPMLIRYSGSRVAHLGCRTGYPAEPLAEHLPGCTITGADSSPAALELARTKASLLQSIGASYYHAEGIPTPLPSGEFSHALVLHPDGRAGDYGLILSELFRVLTEGGQMVMALPLRGSFPALYDLLREFALRHDLPHFGEAVDAGAAARPNPETIVSQCETAGFSEVDVCVELCAIPFEDGRDFLEDPISRLVVGPDLRFSLPIDAGVDEGMMYLADAISKYWSELGFHLEINIGAVSARKL